jgi:radical SAM protein with 4Fe4S-binding SPASM domain
MGVKPYEVFFDRFFRDKDPGDFPLRFAVETTNLCNLRCPMCPREISDRGYGLVDVELMKSCAEQAGSREIIFYTQGFGESFLHPRFHEILGHIKNAGVRYLCVINNGTQLTDENIHALIDADTGIVIVSIDGAEKDVFERSRKGADYDQVVAGTRRLFELRRERGAERPAVVLSVVGSDEVRPTLDAFKKMWEPWLGEHDEIFVCSVVSWAGTMSIADTSARPRPEPDKKRAPCRMLYKTLTVYYDGRATPCCYDHACKLEVGNAKTQTIEEIWNGEELARLRRLHEEGRVDEIELCRGCPDYIE